MAHISFHGISCRIAACGAEAVCTGKGWLRKTKEFGQLLGLYLLSRGVLRDFRPPQVAVDSYRGPRGRVPSDSYRCVYNLKERLRKGSKGGINL